MHHNRVHFMGLRLDLVSVHMFLFTVLDTDNERQWSLGDTVFLFTVLDTDNERQWSLADTVFVFTVLDTDIYHTSDWLTLSFRLHDTGHWLTRCFGLHDTGHWLTLCIRLHDTGHWLWEKTVALCQKGFFHPETGFEFKQYLFGCN